MIQLRTIRKERALTMESVASIIGITRQTYSRIEQGKSQITLAQAVKLAEYFDMSVDTFVSQDVHCELPEHEVIDRDKYAQIIKSFIYYAGSDSDKKITKTKLAKLCYLLDFSWYYDHLSSITGLQYRRIQQGPVPDAYFTALEMLEDEESISITQSGRAYMIANITDPDETLLTTEEKEVIQTIARKWKGANTQQIVEFTHSQLPWMLCDEKELIPYELIIQEAADHVF